MLNTIEESPDPQEAGGVSDFAAAFALCALDFRGTLEEVLRRTSECDRVGLNDLPCEMQTQFMDFIANLLQAIQPPQRIV